jgi:hypothetical protein
LKDAIVVSSRDTYVTPSLTNFPSKIHRIEEHQLTPLLVRHAVSQLFAQSRCGIGLLKRIHLFVCDRRSNARIPVLNDFSRFIWGILGLLHEAEELSFGEEGFVCGFFTSYNPVGFEGCPLTLKSSSLYSLAYEVVDVLRDYVFALMFVTVVQ